ncbi:hypothetical protein N7470_008986 [Penicillium chermesinum]|nr:hypothetical protein N7470_008986 [Penicillium chermesinum]
MSKLHHPARRLLVFQETRNPQNQSEIVYLPVNKLGLPICDGPELPSILELPLRILKVFTEMFNQPKYKGWAVLSPVLTMTRQRRGSFYAVVLEQTLQAQGQPQQEAIMGSPP